jgi:hypothetical protein
MIQPGTIDAHLLLTFSTFKKKFGQPNPPGEDFSLPTAQSPSYVNSFHPPAFVG